MLDKINTQTKYSGEIDSKDRQLIIATQKGLPLHPHPYDVLAKELEISASEVMQRLKNMLDHKIIRRIAAVPNHYRLGFCENGMTVWNVPDTKVTALGNKVGALNFVSHCYQRPRFLPEWPYNLFAMVHAKDRAESMKMVDEISMLLGTDDQGHEVLFSTRILKKSGLRLVSK